MHILLKFAVKPLTLMSRDGHSLYTAKRRAFTLAPNAVGYKELTMFTLSSSFFCYDESEQSSRRCWKKNFHAMRACMITASCPKLLKEAETISRLQIWPV